MQRFNYKAACGELQAEVSTKEELADILSLFRSLSLDSIHVYERGDKDEWVCVKEIGKCMSVESE